MVVAGARIEISHRQDGVQQDAGAGRFDLALDRLDVADGFIFWNGKRDVVNADHDDDGDWFRRENVRQPVKNIPRSS